MPWESVCRADHPRSVEAPENWPPLSHLWRMTSATTPRQLLSSLLDISNRMPIR